MSQLDELLSRSRAPGRLLERRNFTLSREKAIEKQREFALRHPNQYVLELVQAAVFAGSTYIAIDTRPDSLLVAWVGGRALNVSQLQELFDWLFADRGNADTRHLVQIAIAVNALLQREPASLRIESGDGETAVRLDLDRTGRGTAGIPETPLRGTYLSATFTQPWFARFKSVSTTDEHAMVEERCVYTPVPILLNGSAPFGYRGRRSIELFGTPTQRSFDEDGRRGAMAEARPGGPKGFRIVVGGTWVSTLPLREVAEPELMGVVCDDRLRKTADQGDVVQDRRYFELIHALAPIATDLIRLRDSTYQPPALRPLPPPESEPNDRPAGRAAPAVLTVEPVPDPVPMLAPRREMRAHSLVPTEPGAPLFRVDPQHVSALQGRTAGIDRFPWRVAVLNDNQARGLLRSLGETPLHQLTALTDLDFVRRAIDRTLRVRRYTARPEGSSTQPFHVVLQRTLAGPRPDWAQGAPGIPFCVVGPNHVIEHGSIHAGQILSASSGPRAVAFSTDLPGVELEVHTDGERLDAAHLNLAAAHAHELVNERTDEPDPLLSALIGSLGRPGLRPEPRATFELPEAWPSSLGARPLGLGKTGSFSLGSLLAALDASETIEVADLATVLSLEALEEKLGFGHLAHPSLDAVPVFAAVFNGSSWVWNESPHRLFSQRFGQAVWVPASLGVSRPDEHYAASAVRGKARGPAHSWVGAWRCLLDGLLSRDLGPYAVDPVSVGRVHGMARLARLQLASLLEDDGSPVLLGTDGTVIPARDLPPNSTVIPRHAVDVQRPDVLAVTLDEWRATAGLVTTHLRYPPIDDVVVRVEVRGKGLRGTVSLPLPHQPHARALVRGPTASATDAELEEDGFGVAELQTTDGTLTESQRLEVRLASAQLVRGLRDLIRGAEGSNDEPHPSARAYARSFVDAQQARSGPLEGIARELAELLGEPHAEPPHGRQPEDRAVLSRLVGRIEEALRMPLRSVRIDIDVRRSDGPGRVDEGTSDRARVVLHLHQAHPLTAAALEAPGAARELLVLDLVRRVCDWGRKMDYPHDLIVAQRAILGQRARGA